MARPNRISNFIPDYSEALVSSLEPRLPQAPLPGEEQILLKLMSLLNEDFAPRAALIARPSKLILT